MNYTAIRDARCLRLARQLANSRTKIAEAKKYLESEGYTVLLLEQWMRPHEYREAIGMKAATISERLKLAGCPPYASRRSATGRLLQIQPNDALTNFLLEYGKPRGKSGRGV